MNVSVVQAAVKPIRVTVANQVRRLIALAAILSLVAIGVWVERGMATLADRIIAAVVTFGPAATYLFGYFYWLPDVLGAPVKRKGSLLYRWSSLARISAAAASAAWIAWLSALIFASNSSNFSGSTPKALLVVFGAANFLIPPFLMFACVAASEQYLVQTIFAENSEKDTDRHPRWRALIGRLSRRIARWFTTMRALSCGSALVLATLLLNTTLMGNCGNDARKGYEIVTGKAVWVTAQQTETPNKLIATALAALGRWSYVLALGVAVVFLFACISGTRRASLRQNKLLVVITGWLGLYAICDFTFAWVRLTSWPLFAVVQLLQALIWLAAWIVPAALWTIRARQPERWDHTRVAIMIALLPIVFFTCTMAVFTALGFDDDNLYGLGAYLVGILLLCWGAAQSTAGSNYPRLNQKPSQRPSLRPHGLKGRQCYLPAIGQSACRVRVSPITVPATEHFWEAECLRRLRHYV